MTSVRASATRCASPPGALRRHLVEQVGDAHHLGDLGTRFALRSAGTPLHAQAELDVLRDRLVRKQSVALEHHAEAAVARLEIVDHAAVDADLARGRVLEAGDHAQRRGLAAAGRTDEHHELAVLDGEGEIATATTAPNVLRRLTSSMRATAILRTMPKLKPRARCLRMIRPTIISGMVMPTASAACRP